MRISRRSILGKTAIIAAGSPLLGGIPTVATAGHRTALGEGPNDRLLAQLLARDKLLWSPNVQPEGYKIFEKILATRRVRRASIASQLNRRQIPDISYLDRGRQESLDDFMRLEHVAGLIAIKDGVICLERYGLGMQETDHWTSMSMVKSITSTLVGCAMRDRLFPSLEVTAATYVEPLKNTPYGAVTLRQLLTMNSGIRWNEDYTNPSADINLHYEKAIADRERGGILAHLRTLPSVAIAGSRFHYNTADTFVIGCMLSKVVGGTLADYFSKRIWAHIGTEKDALFLLESDDGQEVGGSSASASLRDYARFGMFMLGGGVAGGRDVLPPGWVKEATSRVVSIPPAAFDLQMTGYGYQWWVSSDGSYSALGFAGQTLRIEPERRTVIVMLCAVPTPVYRPAGEESTTRRSNFIRALDRAMS